MKLKLEWISGNRVHLLENGDTYFPAVFDAIDAAKREVLIETFILFEDSVGHDLHQHLIGTAARGVEDRERAVRGGARRARRGSWHPRLLGSSRSSADGADALDD